MRILLLSSLHEEHLGHPPLWLLGVALDAPAHIPGGMAHTPRRTPVQTNLLERGFRHVAIYNCSSLVAGYPDLLTSTSSSTPQNPSRGHLLRSGIENNDQQ